MKNNEFARLIERFIKLRKVTMEKSVHITEERKLLEDMKNELSQISKKIVIKTKNKPIIYKKKIFIYDWTIEDIKEIDDYEKID